MHVKLNQHQNTSLGTWKERRRLKRQSARLLEGASWEFPSGLHLTVTMEVLWMDSITAARRLHRSWAWLTWTLGGSFRTTASAEPSRTRGRNSPSFTCNDSGKREEAAELSQLSTEDVEYHLFTPSSVIYTDRTPQRRVSSS